ncbi:MULTISPECIES: radical SAM protein [Melioribacter]|nr:radical SAM protein [Melioribacter roseus]
MNSFPEFISFTLTNGCNLRCQMCGQWSENGYVKNRVIDNKGTLKLEDWKRLVDEIANYKIRFILIRGGEPFLFNGIIDLLKYINGKGIFLSVDTNGTLIDKYAGELAKITNMHITFSVDGDEEAHDNVRMVNGSFEKIKNNIRLLNEMENKHNNKISKSICFTISKYNYTVLSKMPAVARSMGIGSINTVPYYYFSKETGDLYKKELEENFNIKAFSWKGFNHNDSGVNFSRFEREYSDYLEDLNGIENFPYMPFKMDEYKIWFNDSSTPVGSLACNNIENLIDIQPNGDVNFCVDFPDYKFGNVKTSSIKELWHSAEAEAFRKYRRNKPLAVCYRCGAKYISEIKE